MSNMHSESFEHPLKGKIYIHDLDETEALVILSSIESLGSVKIRILLATFGSAIQALSAPADLIATLPGFGAKIIPLWNRWKTESGWKRNLLLAEKEKAQIIPFNSPMYPKKLLDLSDPPIVLYVMGDIAKVCTKGIAIIGTRQASIYGNEMAKHFASELAAMGFVILSGMARGIDTAAHLGALERGTTAAVIGSGLADIYPAENRNLAGQIASNGCLISEFPMATPPDRQNFPQRNRIVAALSIGILLIEAPIKSGAMITMNLGYEMHKKLFALPGRVDNKNFCGNHELIKTGKGQLVESPLEVANTYNDLFGAQRRTPHPTKAPIQLDKEEAELLQLLPLEEITIEEIVQRTQLPMSALNVLLMSMVLKRAIKEFPGKVYKKQGVL